VVRIALGQIIQRLVYRHDVAKRIGGRSVSIRDINELDHSAVDSSWPTP
jgi:hypothetical protein